MKKTAVSYANSYILKDIWLRFIEDSKLQFPEFIEVRIVSSLYLLSWLEQRDEK